MANHITNLNIEAYRGIKSLEIEDLGNINIFVGDNNTGKTSVLEAIQLICNPSEYNLIRIARQRERYRTNTRMGLNILDSILCLFNIEHFNKERNYYHIRIKGTINNQVGNIDINGRVVNQLIDLNEVAKYNAIIRSRLNRSIIETEKEIPTFIGKIDSSFPLNQLSFVDNSMGEFEINEYSRIMQVKDKPSILEVKFIQTVDHIIEDAFSMLIKDKDLKEKSVELLKEFDESITDIRYINDNGRFIPIIETNDKNYLPLSMYGDGMKKSLIMLNAIVSVENGVVLIDEFETALHTSAMKQVFKFILDISRQLNVQLFLTTHSIEAVDKLLESAEQDRQDIRIVRLKKKDGITSARVLNGNEAFHDRKEYNMELRI
ncbi:AAA family ATPase [Tissierella pigra]|uniref:AAA family ATPase n=1 Tax=Tissierella pigra TaxID=2607614 RepID=A0A6N7XRV0_9FIRM|nr:AAA family ATPase [Tissierella pigra]MSU00133.1 AAA family ATPase [Tissierella pigra]